MKNNKNIKVFISHSGQNKDIANALSVLIQTGAKVTDVFCSSRPGDDILGGENFVDCINDNLKNCDIFIALFSPNYLDSQYCMIELGAAHAFKKNVIPLVMYGTGFDETTPLCTLLQGIAINDDKKLGDISDSIRKFGHDHKTTTWNTAQAEFIEKIISLLDKQISPNKVVYSEYEKKVKENTILIKEIGKLKKQLDQTELELEAVSQLKDKDEVNTIKNQFEDNSIVEKFENLVNDIKTEIKKYSRAVRYLCYKNYTENEMVAYKNMRFDYSLSDDDIENGYIIRDENAVYINKDARRLRNLFEKLDELANFINFPTDTLAHYIDEKYDVDIDISNKEFWKTCFEINI